MNQKPFPRIGLIGKSGDRQVAHTLTQLAARLAAGRHEILLDATSAALLDSGRHEVVDRTELAQRSDLAIVVGGDGTLLNAARSLAESKVAVLGVNLGRLGFLVDVSPEDMTGQLDRILEGHYQEEHRTLLHARMTRTGTVLSEATALNDVIVHKRDIARMIELDTWIDGHFLNTTRSDGLIVTTPTGSTAYALSGGGPVLHPDLCAIALVPICPHTLSNRPIVVSDKAVIDVVLHEGTLEATVSCDGQISQPLEAGDHVQVHRHAHTLRLLHPEGHDYFAVLRRKLRWSEQP